MKKRTVQYVILIFLFTLVYSIVRYNIFKDIPWTDLPLYVINKAVSFSAIIYIAMYIILEKKNYHEISTKIRKYATKVVFTHIAISFIILSPSYYPKFFDGPKLNLIGQLSLLAGIVSFGLINSSWLVKTLKPKMSISLFNQYGTELLLLIIALHLFLMGYQGWSTPSNWPGGMPPITLLSFVAAIIPLFVKKKGSHN